MYHITVHMTTGELGFVVHADSPEQAILKAWESLSDSLEEVVSLYVN